MTVIAQEKGRNTRENVMRNFAMPSPEGYRKALRLMKQAEKFGRPVICFVDTPGAFCGMEAEERGQGEAIARNLFEMSGLKVPILSIVIGEAAAAVPLLWRWQMRCGCLKILFIQSYHRKVLQVFYGKTAIKQRRRQL